MRARLAVALANILTISSVTGASLTDFQCYTCDSENPALPAAADCNAEQRKSTSATAVCQGDQKCGIRYFKNGAKGSGGPYIKRFCLDDSRYQSIIGTNAFSIREPLLCGYLSRISGRSVDYDCTCQGKLCNWYPLSSVVIAVNNPMLGPGFRLPIPSISDSGELSSASSSSDESGSVSKPAAPSGPGSIVLPGNPSGSGSTGGSALPSAGGSSSGSGEGSASGTNGAETAGAGDTASGSGEGDGTGTEAAGAAQERAAEGSASGKKALAKGGIASNQSVVGNGTDSTSTQGSSSLGTIGGIAGGLVAVCAIGGGVYYWQKTKRAKKREEDEEDEEE